MTINKGMFVERSLFTQVVLADVLVKRKKGLYYKSFFFFFCFLFVFSWKSYSSIGSPMSDST